MQNHGLQSHTLYFYHPEERRIASFPTGFAVSASQVPNDLPGALRPPDYFVRIRFFVACGCRVPQKSPRCASCVGLFHCPLILLPFDQASSNSRKRAGMLPFHNCLCCYWAMDIQGKSRRASRAGLLQARAGTEAKGKSTSRPTGQGEQQLCRGGGGLFLFPEKCCWLRCWLLSCWAARNPAMQGWG